MQRKPTEYFEELNFCKVQEYALSQKALKKISKSYHPSFLKKILRGGFTNQSVEGAFAQSLYEHYPSYPLKLRTEESQVDGEMVTKKLLWELIDSQSIESVLIPMKTNKGIRSTLCVSSQVGCAMACQFCRTGTMGLSRNLNHVEILSQVVQASKLQAIGKIVFMGMGEPLHNLEQLLKAITRLTDPDCFGMSSKNITVSTSGLVPQIEELGHKTKVRLAVSLNATTNEVRDLLMPINRKYPIETLLDACRKYPCNNSNRILFEYVLIKGVNDSLQDAKRLVNLLRNIPSKVNLIPLNPAPEMNLEAPSISQMLSFRDELLNSEIMCTFRETKGAQMLGACGQLKVESNRKRSRA